MSADRQNPRTEPVSAAALPTLLSVMFINLLGFGIIVPLLPFYAKSFQAPAWQIALSLGISDRLGLARFQCVQPRYNLLYREIESELLPDIIA